MQPIPLESAVARLADCTLCQSFVRKYPDAALHHTSHALTMDGPTSGEPQRHYGLGDAPVQELHCPECRRRVRVEEIPRANSWCTLIDWVRPARD